MRKPFEIYFMLSMMMITCSCGEHDNHESATASGKNNSSKADTFIAKYLNVIRELHEFECDYMTRAGNQKKYSTTYEFRSDVFQEILRDVNRGNLAKYESINYRLADIEHRMSDEEKKIASEKMEIVYQKGCDEK